MNSNRHPNAADENSPHMGDDAIEIAGSSEEEATQRACDALNTRKENLGYEIISQGKKKGLMGFITGAKVKIRAWRKDARGEAGLSEAGKLAKQAVSTILQAICEDFNVEVNEQSETVVLEMQTDEGGLVIGKNGQTLDAIQYIVRRIVSKQYPDFEKQIVVNSEGYRERRRDNLVMMARKVASRVRRSRRKEVLRPMNAFERRIVHMALEEERGISSRSQGEGNDRCIVVMPASGGGGGGGRREEKNEGDVGNQKDSGGYDDVAELGNSR